MANPSRRGVGPAARKSTSGASRRLSPPRKPTRDPYWCAAAAPCTPRSRPGVGGCGAQPREENLTSMSHFEAKSLYPTTYRTSFCSSDRALHTNEYASCVLHGLAGARGRGGHMGCEQGEFYRGDRGVVFSGVCEVYRTRTTHAHKPDPYPAGRVGGVKALCDMMAAASPRVAVAAAAVRTKSVAATAWARAALPPPLSPPQARRRRRRPLCSRPRPRHRRRHSLSPPPPPSPPSPPPPSPTPSPPPPPCSRAASGGPERGRGRWWRGRSGGSEATRGGGHV